MKGAPLVLVLLDAFRWDYLTETGTPFLWAAAGRGRHVRRVRPGFGFCERAEILTGRKPAETGLFTAIGYDPAGSPYRRWGPVLRRLGWEARLPPLARKVVRRILERGLLRGRPGLRPYLIPLDLLPYLALTEDRFDHGSPGALGAPSLLDRISQGGGRASLAAFTSLRSRDGRTDAERLDRSLVEAESGADLVLVYVSEPDRLGHLYGPDHPALAEGLSAVDETLREHREALERRCPGSRVVYLGDHGMTAVHQTVDCGGAVKEIAHRNRLRWRKDYFTFLDSTLCRIWCGSDDVRELMRRELEGSARLFGRGRLLTEELASRLSVPLGDRRYGDLIWAADVGTVLQPDYFRSAGATPAGMHGYDPDHPDSHGMCIIEGEGVAPAREERMELTDAFDLLWSQYEELRTP